MPKTFDVLLGIATIMLLLSLAVTAITHYLVSLLNLRGRHLKRGLATLIAGLDERLAPPHGGALANAILTDPSVCETAGRLGSFLHRAQLTRLCLGMAAEAAEKASVSGMAADPRAYAGPGEALYWTLRAHGIADPRNILDRISYHALELEQVHPDLPETARLELGLLSAGGAPFVAKVNACFDQTMDRVSARFTAAVRAVTVAASLGLASFLQIDCFAMVNHLAMDESLRSQLVRAELERHPAGKAGSQPDLVAQVDLVRVPVSWQEWRREWVESDGGFPPGPAHTGGILLTALLLSLGAPFWFNLLGGALKLRPTLSAREDRAGRARRFEKPAGVIPFAPTSSPASSARLPESGEWHPARETRYNAGHR